MTTLLQNGSVKKNKAMVIDEILAFCEAGSSTTSSAITTMIS